MAILHITSRILYWLWYYCVIHFLAISLTWTLSLITMFNIKMGQIQNYLNKLTNQCFTKNKYWNIRRHLISSIRFFFKANQMYGKLFLVILFGFCTANILFTLVLFISDQLPWINRALLTLYVCWQNVFLFAIHLAITQCSKFIHRPGKVLLKLMVKSRHRVGIIRSRITLCHDIFAFHTVNRYVPIFSPIVKCSPVFALQMQCLQSTFRNSEKGRSTTQKLIPSPLFSSTTFSELREVDCSKITKISV